jgi:hypothetical protein
LTNGGSLFAGVISLSEIADESSPGYLQAEIPSLNADNSVDDERASHLRIADEPLPADSRILLGKSLLEAPPVKEVRAAIAEPDVLAAEEDPSPGAPRPSTPADNSAAGRMKSVLGNGSNDQQVGLPAWSWCSRQRSATAFPNPYFDYSFPDPPVMGVFRPPR